MTIKYSREDYQAALKEWRLNHVKWLNYCSSNLQYAAYAYSCNILSDIGFSLGKNSDDILGDIREMGA